MVALQPHHPPPNAPNLWMCPGPDCEDSGVTHGPTTYLTPQSSGTPGGLGRTERDAEDKGASGTDMGWWYGLHGGP